MQLANPLSRAPLQKHQDSRTMYRKQPRRRWTAMLLALSWSIAVPSMATTAVAPEPVAPASAGSAPRSDCSVVPENALVDINTAGESELAALPGMSINDAKRIIEQRPFASVKDLQNRNVLSQATYKSVKGCLRASASAS